MVIRKLMSQIHMHMYETPNVKPISIYRDRFSNITTNIEICIVKKLLFPFLN